MSVPTESKPAFEIITRGRRYAIYADGRTEGFGQKDVVILNRIPLLLASAANRLPGGSGG